MLVKKEDRRVQRTRNMLFDALLDLIIEKGYEEITIQDIIDRANIGRSTFYNHFYDKEQLLLGKIGQLHEYLKKQGIDRPLSSEPFRFGFSLPMLHHVQEHKRLYQATVGKQSGILVIHHMKNMLIKLVQDEIEESKLISYSVDFPRHIIIDFISNTFLTLMTWWMDEEKPYSAEEIDQMFYKLILSGLLDN